MRVISPLTTTFLDYPDNESQAVLVFFMGCEHNCPGCQNPQFQNPDCSAGMEASVEKLARDIEQFCDRNKTDKIVFSGGDPLYPGNLPELKELIGNLSGKFQIMIYTAYDIKYVNEHKITGYTFIKCGRYNRELKQSSEKTDEFMRFASSNQKLYSAGSNLLSENGIYYFNKQEAA